MPESIVIDTGDPINFTYRYEVTDGTPPYTFDITVSGIGNSGIDAQIDVFATDATVTFDASTALGGDYTIEVRGRVTDANGDVDANDPDDTEYLFVTVRPFEAFWSGDLNEGLMGSSDISTSVVTLDSVSGGLPPVTVSAEWVGGTAPHPGITLLVGATTVQLQTTNVPPGDYVRDVRVRATDDLGQISEREFTAVIEVERPTYVWNPTFLQSSQEEQSDNPYFIGQSAIVEPPDAALPFTYTNPRWESLPEDNLFFVRSGVNLEIFDVSHPAGGNPGLINNTLLVTVTDGTGFTKDIGLPVSFQITEAPPPPPPVPGVVGAILDLSPDHFWQLDERTGLFVDSGAVGGWDLEPPTSGADGYSYARGIVGPGFNEAGASSYATDTNHLSTPVPSANAPGLLASRLTSALGTIGMWVGSTGHRPNPLADDDRAELGISYNSETSGDDIRLRLFEDGSVEMSLRGPSGFEAIWTWTGLSVRSHWGYYRGQYLTSGDRLNFVCVVQDGVGHPDLYINGEGPFALSSQVYGGAAAGPQGLTWWNDLDAAVTTQTSYHPQLRGRSSWFALPFILQRALTPAEIAGVYAAAFPDDNVRDYGQFVFDLRPDHWMPQDDTDGSPTGTVQRQWWNTDAGFAQNGNMLFNETFVGADVTPKIDWPVAELPGMSFRSRGIDGTSGTKRITTTSTGSIIQRWSGFWRFIYIPQDRGSWGFVIEWPPEIANRQDLFRVDNGSTTLRISFTQTNVEFFAGAGSNSYTYRIPRTSVPVSPGDPVLMVLVQPHDGTGIEWYFNGVEIAGTEILGAGADNDRWLNYLFDSTIVNWEMDYPWPTAPNRFEATLYDMWIKGGEILTPTEIGNLYDLLAGTVPMIPRYDRSANTFTPIDPATIFQPNDVGAWMNPSDVNNVRVNAGGTGVPVNSQRVDFVANLAVNAGNPFAGVPANQRTPNTSSRVRWFDSDGTSGSEMAGLQSQGPSNPGSLETVGVNPGTMTGLTMIVCISVQNFPGGNPPNWVWGLVQTNPNPTFGSQAESFSFRCSADNGFMIFRGENRTRGLGQIAVNIGLQGQSVPCVFTVTLDPVTGFINAWRDGVQVQFDVPTALSSATQLTWPGARNAFGFGINTSGFSRMLANVFVHAGFGIGRILSDSERRGVEEHMANIAGYSLNDRRR